MSSSSRLCTDRDNRDHKQGQGRGDPMSWPHSAHACQPGGLIQALTTLGKGQHRPLASSAPVQQGPTKSMATPLPPHTPQASKAWAQHCPARSRVVGAKGVCAAGQQVPASLTTPANHVEELVAACWGSWGFTELQASSAGGQQVPICERTDSCRLAEVSLTEQRGLRIACQQVPAF